MYVELNLLLHGAPIFTQSSIHSLSPPMSPKNPVFLLRLFPAGRRRIKTMINGQYLLFNKQQCSQEGRRGFGFNSLWHGIFHCLSIKSFLNSAFIFHFDIGFILICGTIFINLGERQSFGYDAVILSNAESRAVWKTLQKRATTTLLNIELKRYFLRHYQTLLTVSAVQKYSKFSLSFKTSSLSPNLFAGVCRRTSLLPLLCHQAADGERPH